MRPDVSPLIHDKRYWWRGAWRQSGQLPAICVNPLTWTERDAAPASADAGSLVFPEPPYPVAATTLPHLTGAVCKNRLLDVDLPAKPPGFHDALPLLYGSYHAPTMACSTRRSAPMQWPEWPPGRALHDHTLEIEFLDPAVQAFAFG